jgi:tetratricopeptide (TPR) repeat protein
MKIVATILSGNAAGIIGDAIKSAIDFVDQVLLIDTGISDATTEIAKSIAGSKFAIAHFRWINDFAAARNFALVEASKLSADFAMTLDTDERLSISHANPRAFLESQFSDSPTTTVWMVSAGCGTYKKERFFRLPLPERMKWTGRTHECFVGYYKTELAHLQNCVFQELPKSQELSKFKYERDLDILLDVIRNEGSNARWWYFLGQTYKGLGRFEESILAYEKVIELRPSPHEQAACAAYCAASIAYKQKDYVRSLEFCCRGLQKDANWPELFWLAGLCCYRLHRDEESITWSQASIAIGQVEGAKRGVERLAFRFLPGWFESPFEVLYFVHKRLGNAESAGAYRKKFQQAKSIRLSFEASHGFQKSGPR